MKIRFKGTNHLSHPALREAIANTLSRVIEGATPGIPCMANEGDNSYWKLDRSNHWFLGFDEETDCFTVRFRYQSDVNPKEEALFEWLSKGVYPGMVEKI